MSTIFFESFMKLWSKIKKVLGPYRVNINGLLATGSVGTGSWQREIPMALLIAIESSRNFVSGASGFLQNQPEIMSRKRKIITRILFGLRTKK